SRRQSLYGKDSPDATSTESLRQRLSGRHVDRVFTAKTLRTPRRQSLYGKNSPDATSTESLRQKLSGRHVDRVFTAKTLLTPRRQSLYGNDSPDATSTESLRQKLSLRRPDMILDALRHSRPSTCKSARVFCNFARKPNESCGYALATY